MNQTSGFIFTGLLGKCKLFNMETAVDKLEAMVSCVLSTRFISKAAEVDLRSWSLDKLYSVVSN